jgi:Fe-S oxidoreductase
MTQDGNISYKPTDGLSYDPLEAKYWDEAALDKELTRAFEVCHGCRMCFKYCDSFPHLFKLLDDQYDGDVRKVTKADTRVVMGHCFQCKLCEVQCPYTPREGHEFQLDFPKLVHRWQAIRCKKEGVALGDKLLGDPDGGAKLARASLGVANKMNRVRLHRIMLEKLVGLHRDKDLPPWATESFEKWAGNKGHIKPPAPDVEVVLFQTCYVQNNEPDIGKDTLYVLEKNKVKYACVQGLACCGMPAWEHGDLETLQKNAKRNLDQLEPYVDAGAKILGLNPTCTLMLRKEYPELVAPEDRERAKKVAEATRDAGEWLWSIRKEERFNTDFASTPGDNVAFHAACHLRVQSVGFKGRDLLKKIPGVTAKSVIECCGHDGTYGMKVDTFEASARIGKKSFDEMKRAEAEVWVTDCPLAATQFEQHAGTKAMHPMSVLARAYRADGFAKKLPVLKEDDA